MSLDLTKVSRQVYQMSGELLYDSTMLQARLAQLRQRYHEYAGAEETIARKVDLSHKTMTGLLARPTALEPFDLVRDAAPAPPTYTLVATDGSQIEVDRHAMATCYLINIGRVYLRYGTQPAAHLSSQPDLYYRDEDLYLVEGAKRIPIEGNYLSARRDMQELAALEALSRVSPGETPPDLALLDGTLMRWILGGAEKVVQEKLLHPYLESLDEMQRRAIPVASYISRPRHTELMGISRLMHCPYVDLEAGQGARCNQCPDVAAERPISCSPCNGLTDADLLLGMFKDGQRGPLFTSMSRINIETYGTHLVHFFYMRVGREVARVEMPQWVATDPARVDLVHSLVYDQCIKGQGYPVVLARAHEQAVVRTTDRRAFERLVARTLLKANLPAATSRKQDSKEYTRY
jgi:hypothetical protein